MFFVSARVPFVRSPSRCAKWTTQVFLFFSAIWNNIYLFTYDFIEEFLLTYGGILRFYWWRCVCGWMKVKKSFVFKCLLDLISQLELGKPLLNRKPEKRVNGIFWIILLNIGIYVADHIFQAGFLFSHVFTLLPFESSIQWKKMPSKYCEKVELLQSSWMIVF